MYRRRRAAIAAFLVICILAVGVAFVVTPRYDAYALMLVGENLSDRGGSDAAARQSDENVVSLALIAETDDVLRDAAQSVGWDRLFPGEDLQDASKLDRFLQR